jgi:ATP-binding cassette subfamily F protein 3
MAKEAPNILLLDEPTNHLDVESREALIQALNAYEGAVILVTHDPHLVELAADRLWLVADGKVTPYDGDLDDYRKLLLDKRRADRRSGKEDRKAAKQREADRKSTAEIRAQLAPLKKAVEAAELEVAKITKEIAALDRKLEDPELYNGPPARVTQLQTERGAVAVRLAAAEEKWLDATSALEAADPEAQAA